VTTFTYFGSVGHNMLMETVFMLNYSKSMESLYNGTLSLVLMLTLILTLILILTLTLRQEHGVAMQWYLRMYEIYNNTNTLLDY
jgi:hypothetical protein